MGVKGLHDGHKSNPELTIFNQFSNILEARFLLAIDFCLKKNNQQKIRKGVKKFYEMHSKSLKVHFWCLENDRAS